MTDEPSPPRVRIFAGPTASGKSARALEFARSKNGVVINADSMQVYDALPTLTAQPSHQDFALVPHRLYGILPPSESCSAARWRDMALAEIESALKEKKTPVICGGTGFYLLALVEGLSPIPEVPEEVREDARLAMAEIGNQAFFANLERRDPVMAERLHPNDTQRVVRAWEVLEATGKSLAYWQALPKDGPPPHVHFETVKILPERNELYARIDRRFDQMIQRGALDEVKDLLDRIDLGELPEHAPITNALGFRQLAAYLRGAMSLDEAIALAKTETHQYAKRQVTFLRTQMP